MKQAIEAVKSNASTIRRAALRFQISFETLKRCCKIDLPEQHPDLWKKKLGRFDPVLKAHQ